MAESGTGSAWRGTYDEVVESAMRTTGLSDFGSDPFDEGLRVLVSDYASAAALTDAGARRMRGGLKGLLVARLMSQAAFAAQTSLPQISRPIFVTGLPRSGTTLLQRLLTADPSHQGLEQWLADLPQPRPPVETWRDDPIFAAMQAGYLAFHEANPELAGLHYSDATTHEECWRLLQQSGRSVAFETQAYVPSYSAWLQTQSWTDAYARHKRLLQLIGANDPDKRWVLKNPSHLIALDALLEVYPDALILVTHRDAVTCVASMCSLAATSTRGTSTVFTGHTLGRTQLDLLAREQAAAHTVRASGRGDFLDIAYDDLVADPVGTVREIYARAALPWSDQVEAALATELARSRSGVRAPSHRYDLADYGLTEADVRTAL